MWQRRLAQHRDRIEGSKPVLRDLIQIGAHEHAADIVFCQQPMRDSFAGIAMRQAQIHEGQIRAVLLYQITAGSEILRRSNNLMLELFKLHLKIQRDQELILYDQDIHPNSPRLQGDLNDDAVTMFSGLFIHGCFKLADDSCYDLRTKPLFTGFRSFTKPIVRNNQPQLPILAV